MSKIYVAGSDENSRGLVCHALVAAGFEACGIESGEALFSYLYQETPRFLLLDSMLPDYDALTVLRVLRQDMATTSIPVIMLSAKSGEYDRIKALDLGADDFLSKPFSVLELVARIKAVLRRYDASFDTVLAISAMVINPQNRKVNVEKQEIPLTYKEFELLLLLAQNKGLAIPRDCIIQTIWGQGQAEESRTLDVHIKSLRQKLLSAGSLIKTVRRVGYKLEDGVR